MLKWVVSFLIIFSLPAFALHADPGILPTSKLYFIDISFEEIQLFLTRDDLSKAVLYVKFADERLAEAEQMIAENNTEKAIETLGFYIYRIKSADDSLAFSTSIGDKAETMKEEIRSYKEKQSEVLRPLQNTEFAEIADEAVNTLSKTDSETVEVIPVEEDIVVEDNTTDKEEENIITKTQIVASQGACATGKQNEVKTISGNTVTLKEVQPTYAVLNVNPSGGNNATDRVELGAAKVIAGLPVQLRYSNSSGANVCILKCVEATFSDQVSVAGRLIEISIVSPESAKIVSIVTNSTMNEERSGPIPSTQRYGDFFVYFKSYRETFTKIGGTPFLTMCF